MAAEKTSESDTPSLGPPADIDLGAPPTGRKSVTLNRLKLVALSIAESDHAQSHIVNSPKDLSRCQGKTTLIQLKMLDSIHPGQFEHSIACLKQQLGRAPTLAELMAHFSQSFTRLCDQSPEFFQQVNLRLEANGLDDCL